MENQKKKLKKKTNSATIVVATLDAVRETTHHGAVSVPNQCLHAQHSLNHLQYFYQPTANPNLEGIAKTVRPREKSFISAISRFQNAGQKKNMNDVRGQEMSENTLLSFLIFPKFSFLRFAEKLRGVAEPNQLRKCAPTRRSYPEKGYSEKLRDHFIFGKNPLFFTKFQKLFSWPFIEIIISFKNCYNRTEAVFWVIFLFLHFFDNWICYVIKSAKNIFPQKKIHFKNFWTLVIHLNSSLKYLLGKKLIKNNYWKINFWSIFILFFYFFFLKTFSFLRYLRK